MPFRGVEEYLHDIIDNIEAAERFATGITRERFVQDRLVHYAVLRALEIISEASRHLTPEIRARHTEIDWRAVADAGNVYRHVYHDVDLNLVWRTLTEALAPLRRMAEDELKRLAR